MKSRIAIKIITTINWLIMLSIPCNAQGFLQKNRISFGVMPQAGFVVSRAYDNSKNGLLIEGASRKDLRRHVFNTEISVRKHLSERFLIEENLGFNSISSTLKSSKYNNLNYKFLHNDNSIELTTKVGYDFFKYRGMEASILAGIKTRFAYPNGYGYSINISDQEYYNIIATHFESVFTYFVYALRISIMLAENVKLCLQFGEHYKFYNNLDESIITEHWKKNKLIENFNYEPIKTDYIGIGFSYRF